MVFYNKNNSEIFVKDEISVFLFIEYFTKQPIEQKYSELIQ